MKAAISLALSALTVLTLWLVLPLFLLPPIAAYLGWKSYRGSVRRDPVLGALRRMRALVPLVVAVLVFGWGFWLLTTQYRA